MAPSTMFFTLALVFVVVGITHFMAIVAFLLRRGEKINWFLIKLYMPKYVSRYYRLTVRETGRPGRLFYGFVIGMNGALVTSVIGMMV